MEDNRLWRCDKYVIAWPDLRGTLNVTARLDELFNWHWENICHMNHDREIKLKLYWHQIIQIYRLIDMGIDGFSTTVFCYGQTGSGKTHTLTGPPYLVSRFWTFSENIILNWNLGKSPNWWKSKQWGIL